MSGSKIQKMVKIINEWNNLVAKQPCYRGLTPDILTARKQAPASLTEIFISHSSALFASRTFSPSSGACSLNIILLHLSSTQFEGGT